MKKIKAITVALLGACACSAAHAQSNVTLYGVLDSSLAYTTHANAAGDSVTKMPTLTGSLPSRFGLKGVEDLGGGLQAIFALESGFGVDTGMAGQGGRLFGRQSYVGLKGRYGSVMLGRQMNMSFWATQKSDIMGPALFSISSLDLYLPNARSDNAIGYLGTFSDVTVGATYSLGRDASAAGGPAATGCAGEVAGNAKACRQITSLLGYDTGRYGATASYDIMYGNAGAANGLTLRRNFDRRVIASAYAMLDRLKVGGGIIDRTTRAATGPVDSQLLYLGAAWPVSPALVLDGQVARLSVKDSPNDATLATVRLSYHLSKRTAIYSAIGRMDNSGTAAVALDAGGTVGAGRTQNGVMAGMRHFF
ncbi:porin [Janthinobacterium sp. UMAB-56]|uniref:porin n=1 Tax=Janthinobacterium sp. UMAB-56 TaxID=1365361 RepID=UPI001C5642D3|nr:porin [Janthinobacterium sp. UMAB-56]